MGELNDSLTRNSYMYIHYTPSTQVGAQYQYYILKQDSEIDWTTFSFISLSTVVMGIK